MILGSTRMSAPKKVFVAMSRASFWASESRSIVSPSRQPACARIACSIMIAPYSFNALVPKDERTSFRVRACSSPSAVSPLEGSLMIPPRLKIGPTSKEDLFETKTCWKTAGSNTTQNLYDRIRK